MSQFRNQLAFQLWLVQRYLKAGGRFVNITSILSLVGMILGVACLVLTMAVVSGFESTLRQAVIDIAGDVVVYKTNGRMDPVANLSEKIKNAAPEVTAMTPFVHMEGILAAKGRTLGVAMEGIDLETVHQVLSLKSRVIRGRFDLSETEDGTPQVLVGKALAKRLQVDEGDFVRLVVPRPSKSNPHGFSPRHQRVRIAGILDLGKYEYDLRMVMTQGKVVQDLSGVPDLYSGLKLRVKNSSKARVVSNKIAAELGYSYLTKDWSEVNRNLFEAITYERWVMFVVVSFLIVTACFNICSSLFVSVLKRYGDLSILKTMGATQGFLTRLFSLQGMLVGVIGSILGTLLGLGLGFVLVRTELFQVPGEVYKLDHLPIEVRGLDMIAILASSCFICFLATLAPAFRGAKLDPVDGLRYE
jgi:lipoprotein-releasing system permease protein